MLTQSSFLIRCWLESSQPDSPVLRYRIEHVQTGKHFDSPSLEEITSWMADINRAFIAPQGDQQ